MESTNTMESVDLVYPLEEGTCACGCGMTEESLVIIRAHRQARVNRDAAWGILLIKKQQENDDLQNIIDDLDQVLSNLRARTRENAPRRALTLPREKRKKALTRKRKRAPKSPKIPVRKEESSEEDTGDLSQ